ncbi:hypothetical protein ANN_14214 [Periplaneta americana]|uniref:Reverse transcriptase domain-containing protein n=1 Tax=Periplaneta americana TaxID=6978 RepID=A0ABQ8SX43_PERAM|nr:hypothetical protein ANN_14214 [Periplaneta americana]
MSPRCNTESYPAFAHIRLRENPGKILNQKQMYKKGGKLHCAFVNFRKAFDTVEREALWYKLWMKGMSGKMIRALLGIYDKLEFCVKYDMNRVSESFSSRRGVKQGSVLSPLLFNRFIDDIIEIMLREDIDAPVIGDVNREGLDLNELNQLLVYEDDVNVLGENPRTIREHTEILLEASKAIGLEVNPEKTKYMIMSRDQNIVRIRNINIGDLSFEEGFETWTLTLKEEQRLRVFENKVLRKIFGAKRDEVTGEWRKLHNAELQALYSSPDIIRKIKYRLLRWTGHVACMGESRKAYRVHVKTLHIVLSRTYFGPSAEINITPPSETRQKQTRNKEISVVIKNVDTLISEDELMQILAVIHPGITRIKRIISAQTDKPTNLVRIFTKDITTADKLLGGIKLAGRYYRVEPSHETIFHRPCLNCAQYGHTKTNCDKPKTCFKCGKNPDLCNHNRLSQIKYCATCNSDTHYTGQARCPKYPRTNLITSTDPTHVPIDTHKPIPPPIPKPSRSVFKPTLPKPELSYADAAKTTTTKTTTTDDPQTDKTTTEQLVEGVLRSAMQKIESYIDRQLNRLQDEIVTFTISLLTTGTNPTKRHTTLATANQAARRLLRKRVAHHFVGNRLRVS